MESTNQQNNTSADYRYEGTVCSVQSKNDSRAKRISIFLESNDLVQYLIESGWYIVTNGDQIEFDFSKFVELSVAPNFGKNFSDIDIQPKAIKNNLLTNVDTQIKQIKWFDNIFSSSIKALMRQISLYLTATLLRFKNYHHLLSTCITLLFGLCCSSLSIVFNAFASTRSTRIFSI